MDLPKKFENFHHTISSMELKKVISPNFEKVNFVFIFCIFDSNFVFCLSLTDKFNPKTYSKWEKRKIISAKCLFCFIVNCNKSCSWQ